MTTYSESTPDLADLEQREEPDAMIEVPVRVVDIGPVGVNQLPARGAVMSTVVAQAGVVQQLVGGDLRRSRLTVWSSQDEAGGYVIIGTDRNKVESETAARMHPCVITTDPAPMMLNMSHSQPVWVKSVVKNSNVSFFAEYWAD